MLSPELNISESFYCEMNQVSWNNEVQQEAPYLIKSMKLQVADQNHTSNNAFSIWSIPRISLLLCNVILYSPVERVHCKEEQG